MALVLGVMWSVWSVAEAHLAEQLMATERASAASIDPTAGQSALTPENIEKQLLTFNLKLREEELSQPAGVDPRPRPFTIVPGDACSLRWQHVCKVRGSSSTRIFFNLYLRVTGLD